jgi:hypothetical protein
VREAHPANESYGFHDGVCYLVSKAGLKTRSVEAGLLSSLLNGRRGRCSNSPPQFGHLLLNTFSVQAMQNVHSNEQIRASMESGGRSLSQHSQLGRNCSTAKLLG